MDSKYFPDRSGPINPPISNGELASAMAGSVSVTLAIMTYSVLGSGAIARASLDHPSRLVRWLLLAHLATEAGFIGHSIGQAREFSKRATDEEKKAKRRTLPPLTPKHFILPLQSAVALGLTSSCKHGVHRSVLTGVAGYGTSMLGLWAVRQMHGQLAKLSDRLPR